MSVRENITARKYENKTPWPEKVPVDENTMTIAQGRKHETAERERVVEAKRARRMEDHRLDRLLRSDLEREHGITSPKQADALWDMAWDEGHSEGHERVVDWYERLVGIIKAAG